MLEADGLVETTPYRGAQVRWLSRNEIIEQGFLVDALEMPAYQIVVERITDEELAVIDRVAEQLVRARRDRDEMAFGALAVRIHLLLFACTGFPRLIDLIRVVVGPAGLRYDKALVYPFDESWDALLALSLARIEAIRARDAGERPRDHHRAPAPADRAQRDQPREPGGQPLLPRLTQAPA